MMIGIVLFHVSQKREHVDLLSREVLRDLQPKCSDSAIHRRLKCEDRIDLAKVIVDMRCEISPSFQQKFAEIRRDSFL